MDQLRQNEDNELQLAERIAYLIAQYLQDKLSPEERDELDEWIGASDSNLELFEKLTDEDQIESYLQRYRDIEKGKHDALASLKQKIGLRHSKTWLQLLAPWMLAAAFLFVAVSIYLLQRGEGTSPGPTPAPLTARQGIQPGKDQAVLILGDGRTVILDSSQSELLATEGAVQVEKRASGELVYQGQSNASTYHTLSTPRGGQYQVLLGDGTRVWLNAASSLHYPVSFTGGERKVELRGEGYFEVAKGSWPFVVSILKQNGEAGTVTVLGTQFNINAYESDNQVQTTLVEGKVVVQTKGKKYPIQPGQQAQWGTALTIQQADVAEAIAWKKGIFLFRDATIQNIGEQIRRWYDVEVIYEGTIPQHFNAEINRSAPLHRLLQILQQTRQVQFTLEDKTLTIRP